MTKGDVKQLQAELNRFTNRLLYKVAPVRVDGELGPASKKRIRHAKWWLGFGGKQDAKVTNRFRQRLNHPRSLKNSTVRELARAALRRRKQKRQAKRNERKAHRTSGVDTFDGRPVAAWMVPYLKWARAHGWQGVLVSGWRDPKYSESLCYRICGRPRCPGLCAGRSSNHSGSTKPAGALDISDYWRFRELMKRCPYDPKLVNHLPRDAVHVSASGF